MANRIGNWLSAAFLVAGVVGCGTTAPSRFYTLDSTATEAPAAPVPRAIVVGPVSVPGAVDRPEFVIQVAPNRVEIDEFERWAAPLDEAIARTVVGDLAVLLGNPQVATDLLANFRPDYRVTIDVQRFDSIQGEAALIEAVWAVSPSAGGPTRSGRTVAREAVTGEGVDAFAGAHSRALAQVSRDIAAAIRSAAASPAQGAGTTR